MANMGRCGTHGCAFSVRLVNGAREEYCPECALATAQAERDAALAERDKWKKEAVAHACAEEELHIAKVTITRLKADRASLYEARRVLRKVEFVQMRGADTCPLCLTWSTHAPDCALAAVLTQEKE